MKTLHLIILDIELELCHLGMSKKSDRKRVMICKLQVIKFITMLQAFLSIQILTSGMFPTVPWFWISCHHM